MNLIESPLVRNGEVLAQAASRLAGTEGGPIPWV